MEGAAYWVTFVVCSTCFPIESRTARPEMALPTMSWAHHQKRALQLDVMKAFSQLRLSSLTKLASRRHNISQFRSTEEQKKLFSDFRELQSMINNAEVSLSLLQNVKAK